MYNSKQLICPDGLFINVDLLFYLGSVEGISEGQFVCMVDGIRLRGAKSEKGFFLSIDDAIDLSLRESCNKSPYGRFRKELAVEFHRWKEDFQRGATAFSFSDDIILNLEVYLSNKAAGKWSAKALSVVRNNRPDLFTVTSNVEAIESRNESQDRVYFIRGESTGNIKIGHSRNPVSRLSGFKTVSSEELTMLKIIDGGKPREKELHLKFAHLNIRREWFRAGLDLIEFIDGLE